jgi:hypothetical protein
MDRRLPVKENKAGLFASFAHRLQLKAPHANYLIQTRPVIYNHSLYELVLDCA